MYFGIAETPNLLYIANTYARKISFILPYLELGNKALFLASEVEQDATVIPGASLLSCGLHIPRRLNGTI